MATRVRQERVRMPTVSEHRFTVVYTPNELGGYTVQVPALPAVVTEGRSLDEARDMARDAIRVYVEYLLDNGRSIPPDPLTTTATTIQEQLSVALEV